MKDIYKKFENHWKKKSTTEQLNPDNFKWEQSTLDKINERIKRKDLGCLCITCTTKEDKYCYCNGCNYDCNDYGCLK